MAEVPETRRPGWIVMTHPDLKDKDGKPVYREVPEKAFNSAWSKKGWVKAESSRSARSTQKVGG